MAIKYYHSLQNGAPTINGTNGSLITALDAILVNGYGSVSVSSITRTSVTATVTTAAPHQLETGDTALIGGAVETDYNGEFVITVTGASSFTYTITGSPATPATGTITCRRAPAGFTKTFSGTNKAVYRSNDVSGIRNYLRIVDDGTTGGGAREARAWGYETMSDVDTGTGMYPSSGQYASGFFFMKSAEANSTAKNWAVITDGKIIYYVSYLNANVSTGTLAQPSNNYVNGALFGDILAFKPGDAHASVIGGSSGGNLFANTQYSALFNATNAIDNSAPSSSSAVLIFARDFTAVSGAPRPAQIYASGLNNTSIGAAGNIVYPHQIDNGFYMVPALVSQGSPALFRGRMPGMYEPLHGRCFPNGTVFDNVQGFSGRRFVMLYGHNGNTTGTAVFDITGPWDS